jgi:hypothetical protein
MCVSVCACVGDLAASSPSIFDFLVAISALLMEHALAEHCWHIQEIFNVHFSFYRRQAVGWASALLQLFVALCLIDDFWWGSQSHTSSMPIVTSAVLSFFERALSFLESLVMVLFSTFIFFPVSA